MQIIYLMIMVANGLYCSIQAIITFANIYSVKQDFSYTLENLKQAPIIDVRSTNTACNSGEFSLFNYTWPGTKTGCNCLSITNETDKIKRRLYNDNCSTNQTKQNCSTVASRPATSAQYFQDGTLAETTTTKLNFCAKRLANFQFYKDAPRSSPPKCSGSQILCGDPASPETQLCVPSTSSCPFYDLVVDVTSSAYASDSSYIALPIGSAQNLYISRNKTGLKKYAAAEFRVSEGSGVCKQNYEQNLSPGRASYVLYKQEYSPSSCSIDDRFKALHQTGEKTLYTLNNIPYSGLPSFTTLDSYTYKNYYRSFIAWKIESRDTLQDLIDIKADVVHSLIGAQMAIMIVNILCFIIVGVILTISEICNLLGKKVPCEIGKTQIIKKILSYSAKLIQTPFAIWAVAQAGNIKNFFQDLASKQVSDGTTNQMLSDLSTVITEDVYNQDVNMLITLLITVFIDILISIYQLVKLCQREKCCLFREKENNQAQILPSQDEGNSIYKQQELQQTHPVLKIQSNHNQQNVVQEKKEIIKPRFQVLPSQDEGNSIIKQQELQQTHPHIENFEQPPQ